MSNPVGVMQGRLLPKYQGRYQAHPTGYWQDEFPKVAELGLDCIEFILDYKDAGRNPLMTPAGRKEIKDVSEQTGVKVLSICADYFMEAPLHSADSSDSDESIKILEELIDASVDLGIGNVVIPCVDQSSIRDRADRERFCAALNRVIPKAALHKVNLSLETDLDPLDFSSLLNELDAECIAVNYDTGNSASLGFDTTQELESYGDKITDLHIKDRVLNGGTVVLGTGSWNYKSFFINLKKLNFKGPIILQAYRDDEGLQVFKKQLTWLREIMKQHYSINDRRVL